MGNRLFQEARKFVDVAKNGEPGDKQIAISQAENALSSAYANSTIAEKKQLQGLQKELDELR